MVRLLALRGVANAGGQITCFTGTNVQVLTQLSLALAKAHKDAQERRELAEKLQAALKAKEEEAARLGGSASVSADKLAAAARAAEEQALTGERCVTDRSNVLVVYNNGGCAGVC